MTSSCTHSVFAICSASKHIAYLSLIFQILTRCKCAIMKIQFPEFGKSLILKSLHEIVASYGVIIFFTFLVNILFEMSNSNSASLSCSLSHYANAK